MKESGMDKLIELLNEYRTEKGERNLNEFEVSQTLDSLNYLRLFIEWLVDNDKIDRDKFKEKNGTHGMRNLNKRFNVIGEGMIDGEDYSGLESILMILSIQDNPIEFLCEILK